MKMIFLQILSRWIVLKISFQKYFDIAYRVVVGIPRMKHSQITANLFLGGQYNLRGLKKLKELKITAVINMRETSIFSEAKFEGFKYLHLPTKDNTPPTLTDLIKGADFAYAEIQQNGKVYIHCRQGLGRGPSMCIAYLLKIGTTFKDAFEMVKKVRPFIDPKSAQVERLKELEIYYKNTKL